MANKANLSKRIQQGLEEWAGAPAHSSRFLDFSRRLLELQAEVEAEAPAPAATLAKEEIAHRLKGGRPLLSFAELKLDWDLVNTTFHRVAKLLAEYPELLGPVPAALTAPSFVLPPAWVEAWLTGEALPTTLDDVPLDPTLLATLIQQTMRPFLIRYAEAFKRSFDQDLWRQATCPVCGGKPEFAYLEKEVGARWCLCATCASEWLYRRMQCPYCGNNDTGSLSFLVSEDGLHRLYLCGRCRHYLKAVDCRKTSREILPALESLTTVAMDIQAQEMGYRRGA